MSEAIQTVYLNESNHFQMESEQSLFCHMQKSKIDLHIVCQQDSKSHIFLFNQMENGQLNIEIECKKDSYCMMSLLDLQSSGLNLSLNVNLKEEGAEFDIDTAQLCDENGKKKEIKFKTSRELREDAYLKLEVMLLTGVHSWEEVQYNELPDKVKANYKE